MKYRAVPPHTPGVCRHLSRRSPRNARVTDEVQSRPSRGRHLKTQMADTPPPVASTPAYLMKYRAGVTGPRGFSTDSERARGLSTRIHPRNAERGIFRQIPIVLTVRGEGAHIWGQPESQAGQDWPGYLWISPGNWRRRGPRAPPVASSPKHGPGADGPSAPRTSGRPDEVQSGR